MPRTAVIESAERTGGAAFGGETFRARLRLRDTEFDNLTRQAVATGYRRLPIAVGTVYGGLGQYSRPPASGLYRVENDSNHIGFSVVVLDALTHTVSVLSVTK